MPLSHLSAIVFAGLLFCAAPSRADAQWIEAKSAHYTVYYHAGYEKDVAFTRTWLDRAEQVMKTKYGVTPDHYYMSIYLLPAPSEDIDTIQSGQNRCCTRTSTGIRTGTIRLLALSAPVWKGANLKSSLGLAKEGEDYHTKVLMSEYIPVGHDEVQLNRVSGGWQYDDAPQWFVQGLQEYDAIFHTTNNNRTTNCNRRLSARDLSHAKSGANARHRQYSVQVQADSDNPHITIRWTPAAGACLVVDSSGDA